MMPMCDKCVKLWGVIILILGILFLLVDVGTWDFWGISWWTALFVIMGLGHLCSSGCAACKKMRK